MTNDALLDILRLDVVAGAKALLGAELIRDDLRARIVETEAYRSTDDPASHAFRGLTQRNRLMFGDPGWSYVYFNYGVHWMLNVTAHSEGNAAAVLIRAAVPLEGFELMRARRRGVPDGLLLSGPGRLTQAFGITGKDNGIFLFGCNGTLRLEAPAGTARVIAGPRVGIAVGKGHETPWRFVDADCVEWASRKIAV